MITFLTFVSSTFLLVSKQALGLPSEVTYAVGFVVLMIAVGWFGWWKRKNID